MRRFACDASPVPPSCRAASTTSSTPSLISSSTTTCLVETIHDEVDAIEDRVFDSVLNKADAQRLYMLLRDLLRLRNAAAPLVNVCRRLEHAEVMSIDPAMQPLFRDVTDHVRRVQEEIDVLREVLAFAFE